jgi:hypothetical protein
MMSVLKLEFFTIQINQTKDINEKACEATLHFSICLLQRLKMLFLIFRAKLYNRKKLDCAQLALIANFLEERFPNARA